MDEAKLNEFLGKMVGDMGAAVSAALVITGDKLGLYKALAKDGPLSSEELAKSTGTTERYVREWLAAQAASGLRRVRRGPEHVLHVPGADHGLRRRRQPGQHDRRLHLPGRRS